MAHCKGRLGRSYRRTNGRIISRATVVPFVRSEGALVVNMVALYTVW